MAKLTTEERKKLPAKDFAGGKGHYPIPDINHARNALARAAQFASPSEKGKIKSKVHAKFPQIDSGKSRLAKAVSKSKK